MFDEGSSAVLASEGEVTGRVPNSLSKTTEEKIDMAINDECAERRQRLSRVPLPRAGHPAIRYSTRSLVTDHQIQFLAFECLCHPLPDFITPPAHAHVGRRDMRYAARPDGYRNS